MIGRVAFVAAALAATSAFAAGAGAGTLTMDQAVGIALARNRDVIAARLEIDGAQLDVVAAKIYPNPVLSYAAGNFVLGTGNPQGGLVPISPSFASQTVHSVIVSEIIDVWAKRSARVRAADRGVDRRRLLTEDALREIVYSVRSAFADVVREQSEHQLAVDVAGRYGETVRLSQARFRAGDISEAEFRKVELEGLRYTNAVIDADLELDLARQRLAGLLALTGAAELPGEVSEEPASQRADFRRAYDAPSLIAAAMQRRPDLLAAGAGRAQAEAQLASAKRDAYPDITLGVGYTHSNFTVSGDNPDALALTLSLPLPIFDRNQANIGRASLDIRRAENETERLRLAVTHQVVEALRHAARAQTMLALYEGTGPGRQGGGMLDRAETSLRVAEKSYRAGAISLLELLEAQRTYLDIRGQYLRAVYEYGQATIDINHAVGEQIK